MTEHQIGRRAIEAGKTVAANLVRLRKVRGLTTRQLSGALEQAGRYVPASGITRMKRAERQVTTDDLMALAAALRVNPSALLLPLTDNPADQIEITGVGTVDAAHAWDWADGCRPVQDLPDQDGPVGDDRLSWLLYSRPPSRRDREVGRKR